MSMCLSRVCLPFVLECVMIRLDLWAASVCRERMSSCHVLVCPPTSMSVLSASGCVHGLCVMSVCQHVGRLCLCATGVRKCQCVISARHEYARGARPCCPAASPGGGAFLWLLFHLSCSVFEEKGEPSLHGDFWAVHRTETGHAQ